MRLSWGGGGGCAASCTRASCIKTGRFALELTGFISKKLPMKAVRAKCTVSTKSFSPVFSV